MEPGFIIDLLTGLGFIDPALAERAVDYLLAWPQTYGFDTILVPAVRLLTERATGRDGATVQRLRAACLEHLRARIAEPLEPPHDWARASALACQCADCRQLSRFLADPDQPKWVFKVPEARRKHVQESSQRNGCDLDFRTERVSRPYSLTGTKNQASYDRRAKQRREDLDNLARLNVTLG